MSIGNAPKVVLYKKVSNSPVDAKLRLLEETMYLKKYIIDKGENIYML
ncbi:MAG: hypothetical protein HFJ48_00580 [Clostridia bacterium]|nr:hypothetical protein [Clostridia bacterium]